MRAVTPRILPWVVLLAVAPAARGQEAAPGPTGAPPRDTINTPSPLSGITFRFEEDAFLKLVPTTDRNYTGGGSIALVGDWASGTCLYAPLDLVDGLLGVDPAQLDGRFSERRGQPDKERHHFVELGLTAFAPRDLTATEVIRGDRPYASLWYLGTSRLTAYPDRRVAVTSTFRLGVLGLDQARQIQSAIHRMGRPAGCSPDDPTCAAPEPRGWHHQISDGGEPTLGYGLQVDQLVAKSEVKVNCARTGAGCLDRTLRTFDAKLTLRGDLGYLTSASAGATLRLGLIQSEFWGFDANPMAPVNRVLAAGLSDTERAARGPTGLDAWRPELYLFASADARATLYNALLQGQFRHSDHRVRFRDVRHTGYDYALGLVAGIRWVQVTATLLSGRSPEADFTETREHRWASVFLTILWEP